MKLIESKFNNAKDFIHAFIESDMTAIWVSVDTFNNHYIDIYSLASYIRLYIIKNNLKLQSVQRGDKVYITKHIGVVPPPLYYNKRMNQNV